jgi:hypothetical protein
MFYHSLVDKLSEEPHCISKFRLSFGELYWSETWVQVSTVPLDRKIRDFSWKIAHGVVYTADRLNHFGMAVDPECFCSNEHETPQHLFFNCPLMTSLLLWAQTLFLLVTPLSPSLLQRHLLFGYNKQELEIVPPVFWYFLNLIKYFVWLARNEYRFDNTIPDVHAIHRSVVTRLNRHLRSYSKRFVLPRSRRFFNRSWNVLGKFSPDIITVSFAGSTGSVDLLSD